MILIINAFITDSRWRGNRYPRIDVFKYTISSYKKIIFSDVYLFIQLDDNYVSHKDNLILFFYEQFINTQRDRIHIVFERLYTQEQWKLLITQLYKERGGNEHVLFLNNDDHVFIDYDTKLLDEGLDLLSKDTSLHKTIYISHWTEIIKLSGKYGTPQKIDNYINFQLTILDSIQIFNLMFLYDMLVLYKWKSHHTRIDSLVNELSDQPCPCNNNILCQKVYVPLKELFRKFDGYNHVGIRHTNPLNLPCNKFMYDRNTLVSKMTEYHNSAWTQGNHFTIPSEWIETNIALHDRPEYEIR